MSGRRSSGGGFTLVEVLVALTGAGLLAGGIATVISGQTRFHDRNEEVLLGQQNVRALADVMAAEIRAASPDDIVHAGPDSLGLRLDVLRAVVCDAPGGGNADLFVYDSVANANVPRSFRGTAISGPYDLAFTYADGFAPTAVPSTTAEATCRAHGADPRGLAPRSSFRRATAWTGGTAPTERGAIVRVYGMLEYTVGPSSSDPGATAVRRNGQELATPFASGARFEYVLSDGSVQTRVATGNLSDIRTVRVLATTATRGLPGSGRTVSFDVFLRS